MPVQHATRPMPVNGTSPGGHTPVTTLPQEREAMELRQRVERLEVIITGRQAAES